MTSLLRQIVAGPRARHAEAGLDLCYVTDFIIATSGPSQTWPQLAYRNPLDRLVAFLDAKHGDNWAVWEFRAEGTGYPDKAVYGRVRHYPWPDHQPPPFRLVPLIMASMRNWLHGGTGTHGATPSKAPRNRDRVVVVHCKAGKGRSGTMATSYLIAEEGWTREDALARFTLRRMRPRFGEGVSIPSQLRWVRYVDRWTKHGKRYLDRSIEVVTIIVWGLRNGVKIDVQGFVEDGKKTEVLHTFSEMERNVMRPRVATESSSLDTWLDLTQDTAGTWARAGANKASSSPWSSSSSVGRQKRHGLVGRGTGLMQRVSANLGYDIPRAKYTTSSSNATTPFNAGGLNPTTTQGLQHASGDPEPGGRAVVFTPSQTIRVPTSDIKIGVERRNDTHRGINLVMVSSVAHVWFNAFFEGQGPERAGRPADSGVFSVEWDAMDGIKGSNRKGSQAFDRMSVVWRAVDAPYDDQGQQRRPIEEVILEPAEGELVPQVAAAD